MNCPKNKDIQTEYSKGYQPLKRFLDIVMSLFCLVILFLPMLLVSVLIFLDNPGKILFKQQRVGRHGKMFTMYKFRTMTPNAPNNRASSEIEGAGNSVTRFGRFLRRASIDELPQLLNILKGDMSFVGPRPLIPEEKNIHEMRKLLGIYAIRPGLTGLAQISGRDKLDAVDKVHLDSEYLKNMSFVYDIGILGITAIKVIRASDIYP